LVLSWETASEINNAGFVVERAKERDEFNRIAFVEGQGTTTDAHTYRFEDGAVPYGTARLRYRLKQVDFDGGFAYSPVVHIERNAPDAVALLPNYPNPFNPATEIRYEVPVGTEVRLAVYDITGKEVALLVNRWQEAGQYEIAFEASRLPSGVYLYRLDAAGASDVKRMILVK
jgi:hypothetical protein